MRSILMAAALAAATSTALADGTDEDLRALIEQQQRQIELLQQQLDATRGVLEELSAQVESNTVASVEANEKAEILADTMESQPAATAPCTNHHITRNARSRRTPLTSAPELSSTNLHATCAAAAFDRRSSAALRRSSIPP